MVRQMIRLCKNLRILWLRNLRKSMRIGINLGSDTTEECFSSPRNRTLAVKQLAFEKCETGARAKVRWTLALARPRGALASREIEPQLPSSWVSRSAPHFSITKKDIQTDILFYYLERETGIEPATPSLARRCSTAEPLAHILRTSYNIL